MQAFGRQRNMLGRQILDADLAAHKGDRAEAAAARTASKKLQGQISQDAIHLLFTQMLHHNRRLAKQVGGADGCR
jgi:hypothetical protein